jgi:hypothetical protein
MPKGASRKLCVLTVRHNEKSATPSLSYAERLVAPGTPAALRAIDKRLAAAERNIDKVLEHQAQLRK